MSPITLLIFVLIAVAVATSVFVLNMRKKAKKEEQEGREKMERLQRIKNRYTYVNTNMNFKLSKFYKLGESYFIDSQSDSIQNELSLLTERVTGSSFEELEQCTEDYEGLLKTMDQYIENPDKYFEKKYHDFLDGSVLKDPVDLAINHPKLGPVVVKVNKKNAQKYSNPKQGPKSFQMNHKRSSSQRYLVRSSSPTVINNYHAHYDSGFGIIDYLILHELLCDHNNGYIVDEGFQGGGGGEFGGGGVTGDFGYVPADNPAEGGPDPVYGGPDSYPGHADPVYGGPDPYPGNADPVYGGPDPYPGNADPVYGGPDPVIADLNEGNPQDNSSAGFTEESVNQSQNEPVDYSAADTSSDTSGTSY